MQTQTDIANILRQFRESLEVQYELISRQYQPASPSLLSIIDRTLPFESYHSAGVFRRLRWGFGGKAKIKKTLGELQCWNKRLLRTIQTTMIPNERELLSGRKAEPLTLLQKLIAPDLISDAESVGLSEDLNLVRISTQTLLGDNNDLKLDEFSQY